MLLIVSKRNDLIEKTQKAKQVNCLSAIRRPLFLELQIFIVTMK